MQENRIFACVSLYFPICEFSSICRPLVVFAIYLWKGMLKKWLEYMHSKLIVLWLFVYIVGFCRDFIE